MPSTLGYALLGLLAREPRTGYDLSVALRAPIGHFWTTTHSQVYPELARLEQELLVRHRVVPGRGPRDTKRFTITAAGRRELGRWVAEVPEPPAPRDEFLVKVYSLWTADPAAARAMVLALRTHDAARLDFYRAEEREMRERWAEELDDPAAAAFSAYATLRRGISFEQHAIDWCDWLLDRLDHRPE